MSWKAILLRCYSVFLAVILSLIDPLQSPKQLDFFQLQALENLCVQFCLVLFLGLSHFANMKLSYI